MRISCHGAARDVTGSCHLLTLDSGKRILVDCGLFQGSRSLRDDNADPFGFEPASIDLVLLTHAHLDHCGRLPLLVKRGFAGRIYATAATRDLARVVLLDAAELQVEEARRRARIARRSGRDGAEPQPLYDVVDALDAIEAMSRRPMPYGEWVTLVEDPGCLVRARFQDAGHILGSASILVEVTESGRTRRVAFSGDLGSPDRPIVREPEPAPDADFYVLESTYGDRDHRAFPDSVDELWDAIADTLQRGGNAFIPSFALERSQELLIALRMGIMQGRLPASMDVYLDSPMAISATSIYRRHPECYDAETRALFDQDGDPFALPRLHLTRDASASRRINDLRGGAVVLAGSGMCTGGRIVHHIKHHLWRDNSSFVFVSYAAAGTVARQIIDGADEVRIQGKTVAVRARVHTINGFSAHAGQSDLLAWRGARSAPTALVHGDADVMGRFAEHLAAAGHATVAMPDRHEALEIT